MLGRGKWRSQASARLPTELTTHSIPLMPPTQSARPRQTVTVAPRAATVRLRAPPRGRALRKVGRGSASSAARLRHAPSAPGAPTKPARAPTKREAVPAPRGAGSSRPASPSSPMDSSGTALHRPSVLPGTALRRRRAPPGAEPPRQRAPSAAVPPRRVVTTVSKTPLRAPTISSQAAGPVSATPSRSSTLVPMCPSTAAPTSHAERPLRGACSQNGWRRG
mmetsp:Transcript_15252/g.44642  ORF Transcript_15252/g.44642 Transcript_15252/m.44642 type:complete len:221 (-) Transcript_15252:622-1284(-)